MDDLSSCSGPMPASAVAVCLEVGGLVAPPIRGVLTT